VDDGVALTSMAHPGPPWYRRWWTALRRPRLSVESLETREIEILDPPQPGMLRPSRRNLLQDAANAKWVDIYSRGGFVDDNKIAEEIQAEGKTAPRVTLAHIEGCIAYEYYITGDQLPQIATAVLGPAEPQVACLIDTAPLSCLTLCVLVLRNGFTVTGESACASPENFDEAVGRKIARQKAIDRIWMLEGYILKERLHRDSINRSSGGVDFGDS